MTYVPSIYKFAHPVHSSYRFLYIAEPLLTGDNLESKLRKPYSEIYAKVAEKAKKSYGTYPLDIYRDGHKVLANNLNSLKKYDLIFVPSVSVNLTDEQNILGEKPATIGMDFFSDNVRLPNDILLAYRISSEKYKEEIGCEPKNYEHELLIPWAHFIMPLRVIRRKDGIFGREALFRKELEQIIAIRKAKNKWGFGTLQQWSDITDEEYARDGVSGNYEFSERMFLADKAKEFYTKDDPKELELHAYINCFNSARMLAKILPAGRNTYWYAEKTKYMSKIKNKLKICNSIVLPKLIGGDEGIMRNADLSKLGASDPSAVRIFAGFLLRKWLRENNNEIQLKRLQEKNARLF